MDEPLLPAAGPRFANRVVLGVAAANLAVQLVADVLFYRELYALGDFPNYANAQNTLIGAAMALLVGAGAVVHSRASWRQILVPQKPWVQLGVLFSAINTLQIAAIDGLGSDNSGLTTLLGQLSVPLTMLLSRWALGARYSRRQLAGAAVVLAGVALTVAPSLAAPGRGLPWLIVYALSTLPVAASSVLTEHAGLGRVDLPSVAGLVLWENVTALPLNLLGGWAIAAARGQSLWADLSGGFACVAHGRGGEGCAGAWRAVLAFQPASLGDMLTNVAVAQVGSAALFALLEALALPIENLLLASRAVMGSEAGSLTGTTLYGLVVVTSGMWVFVGGGGRSGGGTAVGGRSGGGRSLSVQSAA